ncbi:MAG TPA: hypothetical protein PLZ42_02765 [Methanothrix sp.]|nr:hypothetical protein [Methanothrix sp.]
MRDVSRGMLIGSRRGFLVKRVNDCKIEGCPGPTEGSGHLLCPQGKR